MATPIMTVALGFTLGLLIGLTGVGGGALVAPALYVMLQLDYRDTIAVSLVFALVTKIVGAGQHIRQATVAWKISLLYGLTGIPGAILGSQALYWIGDAADQVLPFVLSGLLFVVSALIFVETGMTRFARRDKPFSPAGISVKSAVGVGVFQLFVGVLLGITSVGSGSLVILSMLYLFRMRAAEIVGSNIVIALMMIAPAGFTHYLAGGVDWSVLGLLLLGAPVGAVLGAKATLRVPERALKMIIGMLVVAAAVATLLKAWSDW